MGHRIFTTAVADVYPHYVDKVVDELAKGKAVEKVIR